MITDFKKFDPNVADVDVKVDKSDNIYIQVAEEGVGQTAWTIYHKCPLWVRDLADDHLEMESSCQEEAAYDQAQLRGGR